MGSEQRSVFTVGSSVWVPDEEDAWAEGDVVGVKDGAGAGAAGGQVVVRTIGKKKREVTVAAGACYAREEDGGIMDDMVKMAYLHEPGVLCNLMLRYQRNLIYTYTGSILIAANPFMRIPGIYDREMREAYRGAQIGDLSPHVFAIADNAYRAMVDDKRSQSILISGESGAGKTETTKLVMEYLASVGGRSEATEGRSIESQVLESNPLLEAFGNAKTVRNDNSSRFGKFIEIQFDQRGRVSGAAIRSYLLERSRVVQIADPERNYHCFYQLCAGASPEEAEKYRLPPGPNRAEKFHYLKQSKCIELEGKRSNAEEYVITRNAMDVIGISQDEQASIFGIVAAILHLGNVEFKEKGDKMRIAKHSEENLENVAHLLSCDKKKLQESLCTMKRKVGGEVIKSYLDEKGAVVRRDTLAKTLYSKLFDWIVEKVNRSIGQDANSMALIGVLDIYGFEHFKLNSFEQFCINLANEKLQQHFNQHVLKLEQEEYEREEINWSYINFRDNQDVLDLVEGDKGILTLLDSACKLAQSTPESFTMSLYDAFLKHERFTKSKGSVTDFTLEHYAGRVKYSTTDFISKNLDAVASEHEALLQKSTDPFVAALFPVAPEEVKEGGGKGGKATTKFASLGKSFKLQLAQLMETLNRTEPHYIRCIKPNSKSRPALFEKSMVVEQLRSGGVLEAIRMCSAGYPTRRLFDDFIDRFSLLVPSLFDKEMSDPEYVEVILRHAKLENYQIGKSKIFLRAGQMALMETCRLEIMNAAAARIQRATRRFLFRLHRARAALCIQKLWRAYTARVFVHHLRQRLAATCIQRMERGRQQRMRFLVLRRAAITIQAKYRMHLYRMRYLHMRDNLAATHIQCHWRGYVVRKPWKAMRQHFFARLARLRYKNLKLEATRIAELAPPRKKTEVAMDTIRMMVLRVQRDKAEKGRQVLERQLAEAREEVERRGREIAAQGREIARLQEMLDAEQARAEAAEAEVREMVAEREEQREEQQQHLVKMKELSVLPDVLSHTPTAAGAGAGGGGGGFGDGAAARDEARLLANAAAAAVAAVDGAVGATEAAGATAGFRDEAGGAEATAAADADEAAAAAAAAAAADEAVPAATSTAPAPATSPVAGRVAEAAVMHTGPVLCARCGGRVEASGGIPVSPSSLRSLASPSSRRPPVPSEDGDLDHEGGAAAAEQDRGPLSADREPLSSERPRRMSAGAGGGGAGGKEFGRYGSSSFRGSPAREFEGGARVGRGEEGSWSGRKLGGVGSRSARSVASEASPRGGVGMGMGTPPMPGGSGAGTPRGKSLTFSASNFDKILASMQREVEIAQKMREENNWLRAAYKEAVHKAEVAAALAGAERARAEEAERNVAAREEEMREALARCHELQEKLLGKSREVRTLSQRLIAFQASMANANPAMPIDKQQEVLLNEIAVSRFPFGPQGQPVAACVVYRSLLHWRVFQAEKTNAFDRIIETFQMVSRSDDMSTLSYWLSNHVVLLYLVQVVYKAPAEKPKLERVTTFGFFGARPPTPPRPSATMQQVDLMLFKQQLATGIERLYVTIRDSAKTELAVHFNPQARGAEVEAGEGAEAGENGGKGAGIPPAGARGRGRGGRALQRNAATAVRKHIMSSWTNVVITLRHIIGNLVANHVPAALMDALIRQLLFFVNMKIFNSLMVRAQWCPCTYSNGEMMEEGLSRLEQWVHDVEVQLREVLGGEREPLRKELRHLQQTILFLTLDHKPRRTLEELRMLCPDLSMNQLVHMCIWYEDDKYGTKGVDPSVIEQMWSEMVDDSPMLLRDGEGIPFTTDEIVHSLPEINLDEVEPPPDLQDDPTFHFLLPLSSIPSVPSTPTAASHTPRNASPHLPPPSVPSSIPRSASLSHAHSRPGTAPAPHPMGGTPRGTGVSSVTNCEVFLVRLACAGGGAMNYSSYRISLASPETLFNVESAATEYSTKRELDALCNLRLGDPSCCVLSCPLQLVSALWHSAFLLV
ncbi:unnamed protein product [Closterium sp. Naga37s-1]|nr:unnamed protein product [Closterium sp. Naga37s-1]